jgi:hypothetical protein
LIALGIGIRSGVLKLCEFHGNVFCDAEKDPAPTFELAQELLNEKAPFLDVFAADPHEIMDLLTLTISKAPTHCRACVAPWESAPADGAPPASTVAV